MGFFLPLVLFSIVLHSQTIYLIQQDNYPYVECEPITVNDVETAISSRNHHLKVIDFEAFSNEKPNVMESLVIWPYGSAMSDDIWPAIYDYLDKGGNLLVMGGRPFCRDVILANGNYITGGFTNRFAEKLRIIDAEPLDAPIMKEIQVQDKFNFLGEPKISPNSIKEVYTILVMMSSRQLSNKNGSLSTKDGTWHNIVAGYDENGLARYPLVSELNREKEQFAGGKWILFHFKPTEGFWKTEEGQQMLKAYINYALKKPMIVDVKPEYAFYQENQNPEIEVTFDWLQNTENLKASVVVTKDGRTIQKYKKNIHPDIDVLSFILTKPVSKGLYHVELELLSNDEVKLKTRNGFLVGNLNDMSGGEPFSVNSHFLKRGKKIYPVTGMTYMSSENHRFYFIDPNPVIWDKDFACMKESGVNMIRTGIWTGYEYIIDKDGNINEKSMRAWDAFFSIAKKYDIPVILNFYHMMPSVPGIEDPYTSPEAHEHQKKYIQAFAERYKDNPDIIWDLINEPTYGKEGHTFQPAFPTGTLNEQIKWDKWLRNRYKNTKTISSNWNMTEQDILDDKGRIKLPEAGMLVKRNFYGKNQKPLIAYDYNLFSQYMYNDWAKKMREYIRDANAQQMVITGQDEGGVLYRVVHHFIAEESDFNNLHNWWELDDLLWDNIMAKTAHKPLLLQEVGNMRFTGIREHRRFSEKELAHSLERKLAYSIGVEGAGYIPWIWNTNIYLYNENEAYIGLHRGDGTAKKEVEVFNNITRFVHESWDYFSEANNPQVYVVIPYSLQFSAHKEQAVMATRAAVKALHHYNKTPAITVSEYHLNYAQTPPKLAILPSPEVLQNQAWETLLEWVDQGTILLITGPVNHDPHFKEINRTAKWDIPSGAVPMLQNKTEITIDGKDYPLSFYGKSTWTNLNKSDWEDKSSQLKEISHGKGKILMTAYPVELNNHIETTAALYDFVLDKARVEKKFNVSPDNPGIIVRPMDYKKGRFYFILSEFDLPETITIHDHTLERDYELTIEPGRAKMIMISKETGEIISKY